MRPSARYILGLLVTVVLMSAATWSAAGPPAHDTGAYDVRVRGRYTGEGHAAVGAHSVTITARVKDEDGNEGTLVAPNLRVQKGRFSGAGTIMGKSVTLSGRIDVPDGELVKVARLTCTYTTSDGQRGRAVGHRKGP